MHLWQASFSSHPDRDDPGVSARETAFRLGIVGAGPSCSYVLERLAATVEEMPAFAVLHVDVYDKSGQFGAGLVHSTRQPRTSYLNRIVGQVSFGADETIEGAGRLLSAAMRPTLHEWCRQKFAETGDSVFDLAPEDWPKRYVHGLALRDCFDRYVAMLREHPRVDLQLHQAEVIDILDHDGQLEIVTADEEETNLCADHVLLVTGHSANDPQRTPRLRRIVEFARRSGATYVPCAYPLEENLLDDIATTEHVVACSGMGLTAIDIILYLTEARGGCFEHHDGHLRYIPCGREPKLIVPFSEAGLFTFARPFNGKEKDLDRLQHRGMFLTYEAVDRLRVTAGRPIDMGHLDERRQLDFERHLFPVLLLEMAYVYYRTLLGEQFADYLRRSATKAYEAFVEGSDGAIAFGSAGLLAPIDAALDEACAAIDAVLTGQSSYEEMRSSPRRWPTEPAFRRHLEVVFGAEQGAELEARIIAGEPATGLLASVESPYAQRLLLSDKRFSWQAMIEPVATDHQNSDERYRQAMLEFLAVDHAWAAQGNIDNPAKAAADGVWRDLRPVLAYAVDFGGLVAESHRTFLETYMRHHNRLANGAGLEVMERIRALVEQGIVDVSIGPQAVVEIDEDERRFVIVGQRTGARILIDTLVDAKVHPFDPERDVMALYPNLLKRGLIRKWSNPSQEGEPYKPGGLDLSSEFHPIDSDGQVDRRLTLLGPPSEGVMFFQLGALRPQQNHHVMRDILCWLHEFWAQLARRVDPTAAEGSTRDMRAIELASGEQPPTAASPGPLSITEEHPATTLRRALAVGRIVRVGGVHDGLSALVADRCGVDALWASGLGIAASHGVPDANILTMGEVCEATRTIVGASRLPVIADCDTGFGEVRNLRRTVSEFEHAGAAAICIEDKIYPKRNSFGPDDGQTLIDAYEFATKIRAAKETQRFADFMVIARLESFIAGETIDSALHRGELYVAAGADALVVHSKAQTPAQVTDFAAEWRERGHTAPLIAIPTTYNEVTAQELESAGFSMVIYANQVLRAAVGAMEQTMRDIVDAGSSRPVESTIPSVASVFELTGEEEISRYDQWFSQAVEEARRRAGATV